MSLKIEISDTCTGHGRCYMLADALFEPDDEGYGLASQAVAVTEAEITAARAAADACPESAVLLQQV